MIDKKIVDNIIKKTVRSKEQPLMKQRMINPKREWAIGLSAGIILVALGGWWNVYTYERFSGTVAYDSEISENVVVYRESVVEAALSDFDERALRYENLRKELAGMEVMSVFQASTTEEDELPVESGSDADEATGDSGEVIEDEGEEISEDNEEVSEVDNVDPDNESNRTSLGDDGGQTESNEIVPPEGDQGKPEMAF